ncbi:MAG: tetratricopeptide repeat protein [bacterium]|nr:tetratricopeptide repeat protein [bacterium]
MKKKEREHLKEDPFRQFIKNALDALKKYQKQIYIGLGAIVLLALILVIVGIVRSGTVAKENRIYSEALSIQNNADLSTDQKIEKLDQLETRGGISASVTLILAALHFEKGDVKKAGEVLEGFSESSSSLINNKKKLLEAEVLSASGKKQEALDLLNSLLSDPKAAVPKDFVLLRMAKIQARTGKADTAVTNLNKLIADYPRSSYGTEARNLLGKLDKSQQ